MGLIRFFVKNNDYERFYLSPLSDSCIVICSIIFIIVGGAFVAFKSSEPTQ